LINFEVEFMCSGILIWRIFGFGLWCTGFWPERLWSWF
jgi:hypothetical protein